MNKLVAFNFLLLCSIVLQGQNDSLPYQLIWGKTNSSPKKSYISKILPAPTDGYLAVRHKMGGFFSDGGESIFIESYGSNHNFIKANEIDLDYSGKMRKFQDLFTWKNELYFFTSFRNRKSETNYLFVQSVDSKLFASKKLTKIAEIEEAGDLDEGEFDFRFSKDSTKLLLFTKQPQKRKNPEAFQMKVYSPGFQEIVSHNISLTYASEQFSVEDYQVDRAGNIYLLGILYSDGSRMKNRGNLNYQYVVQFYPQDTAIAPAELKILNNEFFTSDLTIRIADDGKIIGAGYYSKKGVDGIQGVTYLRIDPQERKVISQKNTAFDIEFLTELMTPKQRNRAVTAAKNNQDLPELSNYNMDHLILRSDGGALLIGEQYYVEQIRRYNNGFGGIGGIGGFGWNRYNMQERIDYYYHYDDIIVVNVAPDGTIVWSTHIPKYQTTVNDYGAYSSYALSVNKDKIFLLFNDNIKNFTDSKSANYEFDTGKYSVGAVAEISKDGNSKIYVLKDTRKSGYLLKPKLSRQLQRKNLTIYAEADQEYLFGRLEF